MRDRQKISPRSSGAKQKSVSRTIIGNIALSWSASYRVHSIIYKHLAPLERKRISQLHLEVEFTISHLPFAEANTLTKWTMRNVK